MKYKVLLLAIGLFLIPGVINSQEKVNNTSDNRGYILKVGDMAPDFLIELVNGEKFKLSSLKGKVVMLQFTASWCSVCRKEMPFIESDIWQKHKDDKNFALYGIDLKESPEVTSNFQKEMKITYPITLDITGEKFALYTEPNAGVTRNIIINRDGKIIMLTRLYDPIEFNALVKLINEELKK